MTDFILNVPDEEFVRGVREGRKSECERIVKLLETEFCEPEFNGDSFTPADNLLVNLGLAIELIKGENK